MKHNLNFRELYIFQTVCQTKSMSLAAKQLFISQPAVSQTIIDLEEKLKIQLFERLNKRLILSHAGETLLEYTNRILLLVNEAENNLLELSTSKRGLIKIGASITIGNYLLPSVIRNFQLEHSNIDLHSVISNTKIIEQKILNNDIDLGLVEGPISSNNIITEEFHDDQLYLVASKENYLTSSAASITASDLIKEKFISRELGSGTRKVIDKIMLNNNLEYNICHVFNNIEAIKNAVLANLGISILPEIAIRDELASQDLVKLNLPEVSFSRKFKIVYHKDKNHTSLFNNFIAEIKKTLANY